MKKMVLLVLIVACIEMLSFGAVSVSAETVTSGSWAGCTWTREEDTLTICGQGDMAQAGNTGFGGFYRPAIRTVIIEEGITSISNYAFKEWESLETVILPSTMKSIGNYTFYGCKVLKSVNFPNGIETIGKQAF